MQEQKEFLNDAEVKEEDAKKKPPKIKRKPMGEPYSSTKFLVEKGQVMEIGGRKFMVGKVNRKGFYLKRMDKSM